MNKRKASSSLVLSSKDIKIQAPSNPSSNSEIKDHLEKLIADQVNSCFKKSRSHLALSLDGGSVIIGSYSKGLISSKIGTKPIPEASFLAKGNPKLKACLNNIKNAELPRTKQELSWLQTPMTSMHSLFQPSEAAKVLRRMETLQRIADNKQKDKNIWAANQTAVNEQIQSEILFRRAMRSPEGHLQKDAQMPNELIDITMTYAGQPFKP